MFSVRRGVVVFPRPQLKENPCTTSVGRREESDSVWSTYESNGSPHLTSHTSSEQQPTPSFYNCHINIY